MVLLTIPLDNFRNNLLNGSLYNFLDDSFQDSFDNSLDDSFQSCFNSACFMIESIRPGNSKFKMSLLLTLTGAIVCYQQHSNEGVVFGSRLRNLFAVFYGVIKGNCS